MPEYTYYKIVCKDENIKDCYIGKTLDFKNRVRNHKSDCNNENSKEYNYKLYKFIRENGGWNNFDMIEIETNEYNDKDSSFRERYWIKELNANLNIVIPLRKRNEWYEDNIKIISEKNKEYRKNNKKIINQKNKEYRENNKETLKEKYKEKINCICGCEITKSNLLRHLKTKKHIDLMS
jgi:hypothetical protein